MVTWCRPARLAELVETGLVRVFEAADSGLRIDCSRQFRARSFRSVTQMASKSAATWWSGLQKLRPLGRLGARRRGAKHMGSRGRVSRWEGWGWASPVVPVAKRQGIPIAFVLAGGYSGSRLLRQDLIELHRYTILEACKSVAGSLAAA